MDADRRPPDRGDDQWLVCFVSKLSTRRRWVSMGGRVERQDVPGKLEVPFCPFWDRWQAGAEGRADDVLRLADEDRDVAQARMLGDVFEHLGVVVGGQERLSLATRRHGQVADEVA